MKEYDPKRRIILRNALAAGCVLAVPALLTACNRDDVPPANADNQTGKMSQEQAEYQDHPEGDERCGNCRFFVAGDNTCEVVEGEVSPDGWCRLWVEET